MSISRRADGVCWRAGSSSWRSRCCPPPARPRRRARRSRWRAKIPLGEVSGRIDHLAVDLKRQRLFVAELGNNSLGVVDLAAGKMLRTIGGMSEPQGVAYVPFADSIYVANGGDGSVRVLGGGGSGAGWGASSSAMMPIMCGSTPRASGYWSAMARARLQSSIRRAAARRSDFPSESPSRGVPNRRSRRSGLCQCPGRRRDRGRRPRYGRTPIMADAGPRIEFPDGARW